MKHRPTIAALLYLGILAALPALSLVGGGGFLADPWSELPVKLWGFSAHWPSLFGGLITGIAHPDPGVLNNPDIVGTVVVQTQQGIFGLTGAYNLLIVLQLWATMAATWLLARDLLRDHRAALSAAVVFGLSPLVLVYCVAGAVTDMLNLWPYPLALLWLLRALRRGTSRDALLGGLMFGVGFVTCPYNAVIVSAMVVPLLAVMPWLWRAGVTPVPDPEATASPRTWLRVGLLALLGLGLVGGAYALWMRGLMADAGSLMSDDQVSSSRHAAPWLYLEPAHSDRYVAYLLDYLAVGKDQLISREMGSRYYRAFSLGLVAPCCALLGLRASRGRRWAVGAWLVVGLFFVLASTGPFLPLAADLSLPGAYNPVWMGVFHLLPGSDLILEPFRYALGASLGLGLAAAVGVLALQRRFGAWVGWALPLVLVAELALLSPVPVPLPSAQLEVDPAYDTLDEILPDGAIVELPYFDRGTHRFDRMHFLNQLHHGRSIPNRVEGFLPSTLLENLLTAQLVEFERCSEQQLGREQELGPLELEIDSLVDDGFVAIVIDHDGYASAERRDAVIELLVQLIEPVHFHGRTVFPLVAD